MKRFLRVIARILYRFRAFNTEVLDTPGPVLLVPNHVSWLDWLFVGTLLDDDWKFVVSRVSAETSWLHRKIMLNRRTFPIDTNSPYSVKRMAEHLEKKGRLVLFAEGRLSRTGTLMKLFEGTGFLLYKTGAKVITCYLREAHRLPLSPNRNQKKWFPRVTAHFSNILTPPHLQDVSTAHAREMLTMWLRDRMVRQQFDVDLAGTRANVLDAIAETGRRFPRKTVLEDLTRQKLTYRKLLISVDLLARQWKRRFAAEEARIGVLLPNANATPITILSLWAAGKVPAILNYSLGTFSMVKCAQLAGLKRIITSRVFVERFELDVRPFQKAGLELIYLDDIKQTISPLEKIAALSRQWFHLPRPWLPQLSGDSSAVILFTSGSEGTPKGVDLSHRNLLANIRQMLAVIDIVDTDRFFNALPLFHSFGLTVGMLLPLLRGTYTLLYPSPLHYRVVPTAVYNLDCTVMFGTNTFLNGYARKAHAYDFRGLRYLFAGAEKVQESTAHTWMRRFGVRVLEGYGATECSPCVSANTPMEPRPGSAGRLLPAVEWKCEPIEGLEEGGRLFVRGPNIMRGYLNREANEEFASLCGWYDTGDIATVDPEGYLHIRGRLKRFAKISGEMVSLTAVEEALAGAFPQYGLRFQIAVLNKPDPDKGEALIAVSNEPKLKLDEVRSVLREKGFSNLYVPRELKTVREIPKLGTGKVHHRELAKMIEEEH